MCAWFLLRVAAHLSQHSPTPGQSFFHMAGRLPGTARPSHFRNRRSYCPFVLTWVDADLDRSVDASVEALRTKGATNLTFHAFSRRSKSHEKLG